MYVPAHAHREEGCEALVASKLRGAVEAVGQVGVVAVVVSVVGIEHQSHGVGLRFAARGLSALLVLQGRRQEVECLVGEALHGEAVVARIVGAQVPVGGGVEQMLLGEELRVAGRQGDVVVGHLARAVVVASLAQDALGRLVFVGLKHGVLGGFVVVGLRVAPGQAHPSAGDHAVEGAPLDREVVGDVGVFVAVGLVELCVVERVARQLAPPAEEVGVGVEHLDDVAVVVVGAPVGIQAGVVGERAVGRLVRLGVADVQVVGEEEVAVRVGKGHTAVEALAVGAFHHTLDVVVLQAHRVSEAVVAALEPDAVALSHACAQGL